MEIVVAALLALLAGAVAGFLGARRHGSDRLAQAELEAARIVDAATRDAEARMKEARVGAREELLQQRADAERELGERRAEIAKTEEGLSAREGQVEARRDELTRREQSINDRETHTRQMQDELKAAKDAQVHELERISAMTAAQARDALLERTEDVARHDMAKLVR